MYSDIKAIRLRQWLSLWDQFEFDDDAQRRKPEPHLYLFSLPARQLRALSGVFRRERAAEQAEGIQRFHEYDRSARIRQYVHYGYPYGDLRPALRTEDAASLRKPGWLPTAIIVNLLLETDKRRGRAINPAHAVKIVEEAGNVFLRIPGNLPLFGGQDGPLAPLEVIDGQHRLWAFSYEDGTEDEEFELPVVAFNGLDVGWQAYLFWSINVSPKKINPSHAFDLYPLLRAQDWLERTSDHAVYKEARAQELVSALYSHPESVWRDRINMLGRPGGAAVSQAAWLRSLTSTFFASGRGHGRPGLYQVPLVGSRELLPWARPQQAAFLIYFWRSLRGAVSQSDDPWVEELRADEPLRDNTSVVGFDAGSTMLNQDQGVRAVSGLLNDVFYARAEEWSLDHWRPEGLPEGDTSHADISRALNSLEHQPFSIRLDALARDLTRFDWRSSVAPGLEPDERDIKRSFRGSGGYTALRTRLVAIVAAAGDEIAGAVEELIPPGEEG